MAQKTLFVITLFISCSNVGAMNVSQEFDHLTKQLIEWNLALEENPVKTLLKFSLVSKECKGITEKITQEFIPEIKLQQVKHVPQESLYIIILWHEKVIASEDDIKQFEKILFNKKNLYIEDETEKYLKLEFLIPAYAIVKAETRLKSFLLTHIRKTTFHQLKQLKDNPKSWDNLEKNLRALAQITIVIKNEEAKSNIKRIRNHSAETLLQQLDTIQNCNQEFKYKYLSETNDSITEEVVNLILELKETCHDSTTSNYQQLLQENKQKISKMGINSIVPIHQTTLKEDLENLETIINQPKDPLDELLERFNQICHSDD